MFDSDYFSRTWFDALIDLTTPGTVWGGPITIQGGAFSDGLTVVGGPWPDNLTVAG